MQIEILTTKSSKTLNIKKGDNIQSVVTAGIKDALNAPVAAPVIAPKAGREDVTYNLTLEAMIQITKLDATFIGTGNYMGHAYFWHYEYRHSMRGATPAYCVKMHDALLAAGLSLDGCSPAHDTFLSPADPNGRC